MLSPWRKSGEIGLQAKSSSIRLLNTSFKRVFSTRRLNQHSVQENGTERSNLFQVRKLRLPVHTLSKLLVTMPRFVNLT
jgi:hypothetical protein